ncbi:dickkopf-related protein 2 [Gadus morhua]|uniref:dickkopf-related protein 2 n=1 Tax=Gadus morhua TaxID=8049 RepID=UPI0011B4D06B|nr:dickkopf-related protein 2-like [Gadus morhua]
MRAVWALFSLVLVTRWTDGEARVKLNSIRTIILRETHALPVNRTTSPVTGADFAKLYQCISDLECNEGSYCHAPSKRFFYSRCKACRQRKRRCQRDGMCCPGHRCSNNMCVLDSFLAQSIQDEELIPEKRPWKTRGAVSKLPSVRGQVGDMCLRSTDCSLGLCCARHFWNRMCKPVLQEGQVCTRQRRKVQHLEIFQRCQCGAELSCRTVRQESPPATSSTSSSSSSSSASALSLLSASSSSSSSSHARHASPHTSLLSSSSSSSPSSASSSAVKTRLHICQRN